MFDKPPELSPDLEWMLQSGQVSREMLAEALMDEYYRPIYRLGIILFGGDTESRRFAVESFTRALLDAGRYNENGGVGSWIFGHVAEVYSSTRRKTSQGLHLKPKQGREALIPAIQGQVGDQGTLALCLYYLQGLEIEDIASITQSDPSVVGVWLDKGRQVARRKLLSPELGNREADEYLNTNLHDLSPMPDFSRSTLKERREYILYQAGLRESKRNRFHYLKELLLIGAAILVIGAILWRVVQLNPDPQSSRVKVITKIVPVEKKVTPTSDDRFQSAGPEEPLADIEPLTLASSPEQVRERILGSESNWDTLWQDVILVFYGPYGYVGPAEDIRVQLWLDQPYQTKVIAGSLKGRPDFQYTGRDKEYHRASMDSILRWYYLAYDRHLALGTDIDYITMPASGLTAQDVKLVVQGEETIARRKALVVDQIRQGRSESRMWVDVITGVILRKRLFAESDPSLVILETITNRIAYNQKFPGDIFAASENEDKKLFARNYLGQLQTGEQFQSRDRLIFPITAWAPRAYREKLQAGKAPPKGYDASQDPLTFQFTPNLRLGRDLFNNPDGYADLFAGRYFVSRLPAANPFSLICDRSPNGELVAVSEGREKSGRNHSDLYWLDLSDPQSPKTLNVGLDLSHFVFGPDNRRLAIFGYGSPLGSLYVLDTQTGQLRKLLNLEYVRSMMWSPEGDQLAIIGNWDSPEYNEEVMVIKADNGEVLYYSPYNFQFEIDDPGLPDWMQGSKFPEWMSGLEDCATPRSTTTVYKVIGSKSTNHSNRTVLK
jgi:hypothetical protein